MEDLYQLIVDNMKWLVHARSVHWLLDLRGGGLNKDYKLNGS
jgi:hypothetical protein